MKSLHRSTRQKLFFYYRSLQSKVSISLHSVLRNMIESGALIQTYVDTYAKLQNAEVLMYETIKTSSRVV